MNSAQSHPCVISYGYIDILLTKLTPFVSTEPKCKFPEVLYPKTPQCPDTCEYGYKREGECVTCQCLPNPCKVSNAHTMIFWPDALTTSVKHHSSIYV